MYNEFCKFDDMIDQGCTTFCYCRPHCFYLYEVRPPLSSSYTYLKQNKCEHSIQTKITVSEIWLL